MSDLLYLDEHISCRHYVSDHRCSFRYLEPEDGEEMQFEERPWHYLAFLLEGEQVIDCNEFHQRRFKAGDILLIPKMARFHGRAEGKGRMLVCMFDIPRNVCDKFDFQSFWELSREMEYDLHPTRTVPQMQGYLDMLVYYLQQGVNCEHFHEMKQQEMLLIFRWFYTREELAALFHPIVGLSLDFKAFVTEHYASVASIDELAAIANMSRTTFDETFKREFGMPPGRWLAQRKAQNLLHRMSEPGVTLADLMMQFDFSSPAALTRFCKQHFELTPKEIIHNLSNGHSANM